MNQALSAASPAGLSQIGQIAITVHDIAAAIAFYRDKLGMSFLFQAGSMAFFQCGSVRLMLALPEKPEFDHPASVIYYRVDDIEAVAREFDRRGVSFIAKPHRIHKTAESELWMAFFKDQDDNTLALMAERKIGA